MGAPRPLPPEDDLFARVALHNKLVGSGQIDECVEVIVEEVLEGRPRSSLPSVLIEKGFMSARTAAAVQTAVKAYAARQAGAAGDVPAQLPRIKLKSHAPAGDSQIFVSVKAGGADDKRFVQSMSKTGGWAGLAIDCYRLKVGDGPALEAACRELLASGQKQLHVDIRKLGMVTDEVVRILVEAAGVAATGGSSLALYCEQGTAQMARMVFRDSVEILIGDPPGVADGEELPPVPRIDHKP